jgi:class 3 adenylate cyclase/TolB-like protein/Tfp pilus assembly protein PilF
MNGRASNALALLPDAEAGSGSADAHRAWPGHGPALEGDAPEPLRRATRVLLIVDIAESVRLIQSDEEGTVARWFGIVRQMEIQILPGCNGRLVKKLGDGMLLDFPDVRSALAAALALQQVTRRANLGAAEDRRIMLRIGIDAGQVILDEGDVLGHHVNIAARLAGLAGPGEIVASAVVREQLTPVLDAEVEDLGDCYLRHVTEPVRAFRIGPPGPCPVIEPTIPLRDLLPAVAIIPFTSRDTDPEQQMLGEILADETIAELSRSTEIDVISRLSTTGFRGRGSNAQEVRAHLDADYIVSGRTHVDGARVVVDAELAEARTGRISWAERLRGSWHGSSCGAQELARRVAAGVRSAIHARELQHARTQALPTLKSYTLMVAAVSLMHRLSWRDFEEARHLLEVLVDRSRRLPVPQAWLANWHVLRVQQGWSPDPQRDAQYAQRCTAQALDCDPDCALALTIDGFVHTNLLKRLDIAEQRYDAALRANPNEARAWLLRGTMHAFRDAGQQAVKDTTRALRLSPLDPHRYFYDSLAGCACLAAGRYERALELARRSLRANCTHTSTLRTKAVAEWRLGRHEEARQTVAALRRLEPELRISEYLRRTPAAAYRTGKDWADALRLAGVPN